MAGGSMGLSNPRDPSMQIIPTLGPNVCMCVYIYIYIFATFG